jgi:hypothetical protein
VQPGVPRRLEVEQRRRERWVAIDPIVRNGLNNVISIWTRVGVGFELIAQDEIARAIDAHPARDAAKLRYHAGWNHQLFNDPIVSFHVGARLITAFEPRA